MRVPIVDESDNVLDYKEFSEITSEDIYRVSALWITNEQGQILLSRRAVTKQRLPGLWGPATTDLVEADEAYEFNIIRHAEKALGLQGIYPARGQHLRIMGESNFFIQFFMLECNRSLRDFSLDKTEVTEIKWFTKAELKEKLRTSPEAFVPHMQMFFDVLC